MQVSLTDEAQMSCPALAFASAISSGTVLAGRAGLTTSKSGVEATRLIKVKSLTLSYGSLPYRLALIACVVASQKYSVYPSGADLTTISVAIVVPAPGRLSTTTCWPRFKDSLALRARASTSETPPGVNPTTRRMGLFGYACAQAFALKIARAKTASARIMIGSLSLRGGHGRRKYSVKGERSQFARVRSSPPRAGG